MAIISRSCATLDLSCPTSEVSGATLMEEMDGDATSITLSARVASASKSMSPEEARIIRTCPGSRCRKNSLRNVLSGSGPAASPSNCCDRCRSWEGGTVAQFGGGVVRRQLSA